MYGQKWETHGVGGLNPNFKVAAFESLHSELRLAELERERELQSDGD